MAAIATSQVSGYPTDTRSGWYPAGKGSREIVAKTVKITGVTAGDTATAAVLGFSKILETASGYNGSSAAFVGIAVDPVNNGIFVGTGPANQTIYFTAIGNPSLAR